MASETSTTAWQRGRLDDGEPTSPRPWRAMLAVLAVLVLVDLALARALPPPQGPPAALESAADARAELRAAAADGGWLLLGDSVLAGDVMAARVPDWQHQRVVDHMLRDQGDADARPFHQVALDGLLPVDLLRVVQELDRLDPAAAVPLLVELNPRYFSRRHADTRACSRPWLCELGAPLVAAGQVLWLELAAAGLTDLHDAFADLVPVYRHRRRLDLPRLEPAALVRPRDPDVDPLEARARLLEHYRAVTLDPTSTQVRALKELVRRLRAARRRAVFFTTPLEDEFADQAASPAERGAYLAELSRLVEGTGDGPADLDLVPLDHPRFDASLFLDHCHLLPDGNRLLADNLLHAIGRTLARVPPDGDLVHPEGPDRSLLAGVDPGSADGAAWDARLAAPQGLAVAPGGRRVVLADTDNHVLRELVGDLYTVRVLAGAAGEPGDADGPLADARLQDPQAPAIVGDVVYFADRDGAALRRVHRGRVATERPGHGPKWRKVRQIRPHRGELLLLDGDRRILGYDPHSRRTREVVVAAGKIKLAAIAVADDGRLFVADTSGRIWQTDAAAATTLGERPTAGATLVFANTGKLVIPQTSHFPHPFAAIRITRPVGLEYVARHDGLLVQDDVAPKVPVEGFTERVQLRFLALAERRVYPWIKPMVFGAGYMYWNDKVKSYGSSYHEGSMALEQDSATLFYLERARSRLLRLDDGLLGVAKVTHTGTITRANFRDVFGVRAGTSAQDRFRPDLYLARRLERLPRRGPFTGLVVSSSMSAMAQQVGAYSLVRRLERRLVDALGLRDGLRLDLYQRAHVGPSLTTIVDEVDRFTAASGAPDLILVEVHDYRGTADLTDADLAAAIARLRDAAARHDSLLVLYDNTGLIASKHDGLRPAPEQAARILQAARAAGLPVLAPSDALLARSLDVAPWGAPPFEGGHGSPWNIDMTADELALALLPRLRAHLNRPGRLPSQRQHREATPETDPSQALLGAFDEAPVALPALRDDAVQKEPRGATLDVFVDLGVAAPDRTDMSPEDLDALALAALRAALDGAGPRISAAVVRLARFPRYDEYGVGVREGATVVHELRVDREQLLARLRERAR